jgi:hypothetical protein
MHEWIGEHKNKNDSESPKQMWDVYILSFFPIKIMNGPLESSKYFVTVVVLS